MFKGSDIHVEYLNTHISIYVWSNQTWNQLIYKLFLSMTLKTLTKILYLKNIVVIEWLFKYVFNQLNI